MFSRNLAALVALAVAAYGAPAQDLKELPRPDGKPADHTKKVRVFILLGQSNMLGFGRVGPRRPKAPSST